MAPELNAPLLEALARELHWEMERLIPTEEDGGDWEALSNDQRTFYRLCVEHLIGQPELRELVCSA